MKPKPQVKRKPNTMCQMCPTPMYRRPAELIAGRGRYCSRACRNRAHPPKGPCPQRGVPGERNGSWKGGVTYGRPKGNYAGPVYVRCPADLMVMARADGYVMEHRLVMARRIGRPLLRSEVVDHVDHNPRNNAVENLLLYPSNGDHKRGEAGRYVAGVANRL